jgi:hypothetical protein
VVLNEKLLEVMGDDVTQEQAFAHANDVLKNAVGGISEIIHIPRQRVRSGRGLREPRPQVGCVNSGRMRFPLPDP